MLRIICFGLLLTGALSHYVDKAIVRLDGTEGVSGNITFTLTADGIIVEGIIKGLSPGHHGFHIHNSGDITNGCTSVGGHFNPYNKLHSSPQSPDRHVGDLGNVEADQYGVANIRFLDKQISLRGISNILGRSVVVHSGVDDLGLGSSENSKLNGDAGSRAACGVIGLLSEKDSGSVTLSSFSLIGLIGITLANFYI